VVHVDSRVLAKEVFETSDGKPDCYIEKQVALPVETARRLSCSCKIVTGLTNEGKPLRVGDKTGLYFWLFRLARQGERRANSRLFNRRTTQLGEMHGRPEM
jgi:hypothetical protein